MTIRDYYQTQEEYKCLKFNNEDMTNKYNKLNIVKNNLIDGFANLLIRNLTGKSPNDILEYMAPKYLFEETPTSEQCKKVVIYHYKNTYTNEKYIIKQTRLAPIKALREQTIKLVQSEFISMLHCLHSDYVIRPISLGINEDYIMIMMEDGGISLDKFCFNKRKGILTERLFLMAFYDLAMGLKFLSEEHIYHGDVKPQNILVEAIQGVGDDIMVAPSHHTLTIIDSAYRSFSVPNKVNYDKAHRTHKFRYIDFGAALTFDTTKEFIATKTAKQGILPLKEYTKNYMAPEVVWPILKQRYTNINIKYNKIDIYSLALTMYSVLMGRFIDENEGLQKQEFIKRNTFLKTIETSMNTQLDYLRFREKAQITDIIMRCLDPNPRARSNIIEVIEALLPLIEKKTHKIWN